MLEVAHMGLHVGQMTGVAEQHACFAAVTENGARVMQLEDYGLAPGCHADMVILQAGDVLEALRLKPARLAVVRRGKVIAETPKVEAQLKVLGNPAIDFLK
jgi:cytosine deaminase